MTTTVTPDIEQDHTESQEWPTLAPDLADTTREERADWFDPTQDDDRRRPNDHRATRPTNGNSAPTDDDPTQGRKLGADPYDDPTQGRKLGADPYDDPTQSSLGRQSKCADNLRHVSSHTRDAGSSWSRRSAQRSLPNSQFRSKRGQHESSTCISVGPDVRRGHRHRRGDRIRAISRRSRRRSRQSSLDEDGVGRRPSVRRLACRK